MERNYDWKGPVALVLAGLALFVALSGRGGPPWADAWRHADNAVVEAERYMRLPEIAPVPPLPSVPEVPKAPEVPPIMDPNFGLEMPPVPAPPTVVPYPWPQIPRMPPAPESGWRERWKIEGGTADGRIVIDTRKFSIDALSARLESLVDRMIPLLQLGALLAVAWLVLRAVAPRRQPSVAAPPPAAPPAGGSYPPHDPANNDRPTA
jgi:hypothetical protein